MLDVYWYRPKSGYNLGDEVTTHLLTNLYGVEHRLSVYPAADLLSTGSTLSIAWDRPEHSRREKTLNVVGSGTMYPRTLEVPSYMKLWSVRGHLTRQQLSGGRIEPSNGLLPVGDPGLLLGSSQLDISYRPTVRVGYIPHFQKIDSPGAKQAADKMDAKIIDFRSDDFSSILSEMMSCEVIVSQALHGLILADAMRIPNAWYYDGILHKGAEFKFYDYFSSVGRDFAKVVRGVGNLDSTSIDRNLHEIGTTTLRRASSEIDYAFQNFLNWWSKESLG